MKFLLRSWPEFVNKDKFSKPAGNAFQGRLESNLVYYFANYVVVISVFLLYVCYIRPWFLFAVLLSLGLGYYLFTVRQAPVVIKVGDYTRVVTRRETLLAYMTLASLLFLLTGGFTSLVTLVVALITVLIHASFREKNAAAEGTKFVNVWKSAGKEKSMDDEGGRGPVDIENPGEEEEIKTKQSAEYRQNFRAQMRAKYLQKKD